MITLRARLTLTLAALTLLGHPRASDAQQASISAGTVVPRELVLGRTAKVRTAAGRLTGELLAVTSDSVWMDIGGRWMAFPLTDQSRVTVRMHSMDGTKMAIWNLVAGLGSAAALSAACNSVEDADCGGVFPAWTLAWGLLGGISGALVARSSHRTLSPHPDAIQPYVRFPQGMPPARPPAPDSASADPPAGGGTGGEPGR